MRSPIDCQANVHIVVRDARTGKILRHIRSKNMAVLAGRTLIAKLLNGTGTAIKYFAIGIGTNAPSDSDVALQSEIFRDLTTLQTVGSAALTIQYFLSSTNCNGNTLTEAGLFTAASGPTIYARALISPSIIKTNLISVTFTWSLSWSHA